MFANSSAFAKAFLDFKFFHYNTVPLDIATPCDPSLQLLFPEAFSRLPHPSLYNSVEHSTIIANFILSTLSERSSRPQHTHHESLHPNPCFHSELCSRRSVCQKSRTGRCVDRSYLSASPLHLRALDKRARDRRFTQDICRGCSTCHTIISYIPSTGETSCIIPPCSG